MNAIIDISAISKLQRSAFVAASGLAVFITASSSMAQTPSAAATEGIDELQEVTVVGSRIKGAVANEALPVVVIDQELIQSTGAVSGDELFRNIPQLGDVLFEAQNNPQTSNAARGDVNSFNLRSLGVGNTLVLVNGRRMVTHPTSQGTSDTGTVPVLSYNSNAISVAGSTESRFCSMARRQFTALTPLRAWSTSSRRID